MKRSILVLGLLCLNVIAYGQSNFNRITGFSFYIYDINNYPQNYGSHSKKNQVLYKEKGVKSFTKTISLSNNKNKKSKEIYQLDKEGRIIQVERFATDGALASKTYFEFNSFGKKTLIEITNSKGETSSELYTYTKDSLVKTHIKKYFNDKTTTTTYTYRDKKVISKETYGNKGTFVAFKVKYNENGSVQLKEYFQKDTTQSKKSLAYDYYESGSKKTITYIEKSKIKYVWNYDCKPEGELVDVKNKSNSTICIKEEMDESGNRIVWTREFDENGSLIKTRSTFNEKNQILNIQRFRENGTIASEFAYKENGGTRSKSFNEEGDETIQRETFVDENKQLVKSYHAGKYGHTNLFYYKRGLRVSQVQIGRKSTTVSELNYTFY